MLVVGTSVVRRDGKSSQNYLVSNWYMHNPMHWVVCVMVSANECFTSGAALTYSRQSFCTHLPNSLNSKVGTAMLSLLTDY